MLIGSLKEKRGEETRVSAVATLGSQGNRTQDKEVGKDEVQRKIRPDHVADNVHRNRCTDHDDNQRESLIGEAFRRNRFPLGRRREVFPDIGNVPESPLPPRTDQVDYRTPKKATWRRDYHRRFGWTAIDGPTFWF